MINCSFSKSYDSFKIEVNIKAKGIHGILGASGSGKSTALACIAGIAQPDSGFVEINNIKMFNKDESICLPPQKRKAALVMQSGGLFNNMTALQNVAECVDNGAKSEKAMELLGLLRMQDCARKMPHQLSGGQAQRVAIARAIASQPRCLLLDEPFSALDVILKDDITHEVFDVVKALDMPVLYVSHDLSELLQVCNTISVIENGQFSQSQSKDEFLSLPNTEMGKSLVARLGLKNV